MTDYSAIKDKLLAEQQELAGRLQQTQATEGHETVEDNSELHAFDPSAY